MSGRDRQWRLARWAACGVGLGALVLVAVLATRPPATQTASSPLIGKPAPAAAGRNLAGGNVVARVVARTLGAPELLRELVSALSDRVT